MAVSTRIIRRRIKSIGNTKKITKAMELVAASKMRRAVNAVLATRPYSTLGWETVEEVAKVTENELHPLLRTSSKVERVLVVMISSDRGLCGGFNAQMAKKVVEFVKQFSTSSNSNYSSSEAQRSREVTIDFVTLGKKGTDLARRLGWKMVATFGNLSNNPTILDVRPVAQLAINDFIAQKYDIVYLAYTDFISSIQQVPHIRQLLPITKDALLGEVKEVGSRQARTINVYSPSEAPLGVESRNTYQYDYLFEPTAQEILDAMLPRLVEVQVYQAILESSASEHSARMVAMKSASDAARDMIDDLTFTFNQARQSAITREIAEISAGKAALE